MNRPVAGSRRRVTGLIYKASFHFPRIRERLTDSSVEIYVWACDGLMTYGGFGVDLAAGLEDSIVHELQPQWNKRK